MRLLTNKKIYLLMAVFAMILTTGFRCKFLTPSQAQLLEPIELTWWTSDGDSTAFAEVVARYRSVHPNVNVTIRVFRPDEYHDELLNALAEDRGPDLITIKNTEVGEYVSKLTPLPASTRMAYEVRQRSLGIKDEVLIEVRDTPSITPGQLRDTFLEVVADDVIGSGQIWALPFSVDTLVMFYNRDLLDNANLPLPPTTWIELQEAVQQMTFQDTDGNLVQSGAALGLSDNVEHSFDILSLLMLQNGADMTNNGQAWFHTLPLGQTDRTYIPGPEAVRFYLDFADPLKEVYTWNASMPNSLDAFAQGKAAVAFGYHRDIATIDAKRSGQLNFGIAPVPQIPGKQEINFASYSVTGVSKKSRNVNAAWDFIQFASRQSNVASYLEATARPTALRALVNPQKESDQIGVFANQLLTAQTWYHGVDTEAAENAFAVMIQQARAAEDMNEVIQAVNVAAQKINQTL